MKCIIKINLPIPFLPFTNVAVRNLNVHMRPRWYFYRTALVERRSQLSKKHTETNLTAAFPLDYGSPFPIYFYTLHILFIGHILLYNQKEWKEINTTHMKTQRKRSRFGAKTWLLVLRKEARGTPVTLCHCWGLAHKGCWPAVLHPDWRQKKAEMGVNGRRGPVS